MPGMTAIEEGTGEPLVACHACDALLFEPPAGVRRARCPRCGAVLTTERAGSLDGVLAAAVSTLALLGAAVALPFVSIDAAGRHSEASVLDAAIAAGGDARALTLAVFAAIVALPATRALALIWTLAPLRLGRPPAPFAREAFRLAVELRPWSMMEIFVIGVAVALVKVAGIAHVGFGAAFWIFVALAAIAFYEDAALCRRTVWRLIG
ncbi:MAG: paraquat-inducible protein A [Pikeienuella sp.]|uniref:paraquat-inducible protein A n=1 Tax=Pikeienuella sp. TaxID=2831957 RepID=UPI00391B3D07